MLGKHFSVVVVKHGKRLPTDARESPFLEIFKSSLDKAENVWLVEERKIVL